jgi:hypothetical protein
MFPSAEATRFARSGRGVGVQAAADCPSRYAAHEIIHAVIRLRRGKRSVANETTASETVHGDGAWAYLRRAVGHTGTGDG